MGSVLRETTDFIGLTNHSGQEAAANASAAAAQRSYDLTEEELAFQREQYGDWKDIYGDIQEQLDSYFESYTGELQTAQRLQYVQEEQQRAEKELTQSMAQRGISGSGLEADMLTRLYTNSAVQRAGIRASQEDVAVDKRMQFLGLGLGQGTQMLGIQAGVANTGASTAGSISNAQANASAQMSMFNAKQTMGLYDRLASAGAGYMSGGSTGTASSLASFFSSDIKLKKNVKYVDTIEGYKVYTWEWNNKALDLGLSTQPTKGVIAQDIEPFATEKRGEYLVVDYSKLPNKVQEFVNG
jgi:hypothetical protein